MKQRARGPAARTGSELLGGVWPVVGAGVMRALDAHTIETLGVPGELLMESAGRAVAEVAFEAWAECGGEVVVVCGGGNNGGDGLVAARHLHLAGVPVRAALLTDAGRLRGDAAANATRARTAGVRLEGPRWRAPARGVIVDAIFGTGLTRAVEGAAAASIRRIDACRTEGGCRVVAVDLPSGLDADTGCILGSAVQADLTLTISLPKLGLALEPGRSRAGRIRVARIGIADEAPGVDARSMARLWSASAAGARLPERPRDGHKGRFGHVLVVAGSEGKTGAAALAAVGAGRAGAGLVTVACPAGLHDILEVKCTEAMTVPVADTPRRGLAAAAANAVLHQVAAGTGDVVALGPGVGREDETGDCVRAIAKRLDAPLVIDADGLFAFGDAPGALRTRRAATVLTPHPGEAARLLNTDPAEVNHDRVAAARRLAAETGAVALLKGAASVIAHPDGRVIVNPTGGPALASGGTGDVLTGVVAAFLSQGLEPLEAAALGAYVHGATADRWPGGVAGLQARDLADGLPAVMDWLRRAGSPRSNAQAGAGAGLALPFPGA